MTLLVRNEEDILESNIRYHLEQGVDHIIVTDNLSNDATADIIRKFVSKGVATYIFEGEDNFAQSKWVTRMARMAYDKFGAQWVINSDADEFWIPKSELTLKNFFKNTTSYNIIEAERHDFICPKTNPFHDHSQTCLKRMIYRKKTSLNPNGDPLPTKVAHRGSQKIVVTQGNHSVNLFSKPYTLCDKLEILHFPLRSASQYIKKITYGGAAYANNTYLPYSIGSTWRNQYKELQATGKLKYIEDSIVNQKKLQYLLSKGEIIRDTRLKNFLEK